MILPRASTHLNPPWMTDGHSTVFLVNKDYQYAYQVRSPCKIASDYCILVTGIRYG